MGDCTLSVLDHVPCPDKEVDKSTDFDQIAKDAVKGVDTSSLNELENQKELLQGCAAASGRKQRLTSSDIRSGERPLYPNTGH
jgi:hypothetical protein